MSEHLPIDRSFLYESDHHLDNLEKPVRTVQVPPEFNLPSYEYDDVFCAHIELEKQPYDLNVYSPTPLDPHRIKLHGPGYFMSARLYMDALLTDKQAEVNLPQHIRDDIWMEIQYEHVHRSDKSSDAMERLRGAYNPDDAVHPYIAELVMRARSGTASIDQLAHLLALYPEMESVEVMKYTQPLESRKMDMAHARFVYELHMAENTAPGIIVETEGYLGKNLQPRKNHPTVPKTVFIGKGVEARVVIDGVEMELVGRYSYYVPEPGDLSLVHIEPTVVTINNQQILMYPIAISKYLRLAKSSATELDA